MNPRYKVTPLTKEFDHLTPEDFKKSRVRKIHLFSNILDVQSFDLAKFIQLFQKSFRGNNSFICVGPLYAYAQRVEDFIAAIAPDSMLATMDRDRGEWEGQWTISMRVFQKQFEMVEEIKHINQRIDALRKRKQFLAGYFIDAVEEEYQNTPLAKDTEALFHALSLFDVDANVPLGIYPTIEPKWAVLTNILLRGLPTKAPIYVEEILSRYFHVSTLPAEGAVLEYASTHRISAQQIYEALHVIDPRFTHKHYWSDMLESGFEKQLIFEALPASGNEYLVQLLEPQRPLSSIVDIPDSLFTKDQRVDFALNNPYGEPNTGFILEIDGQPFHSNIFQCLYDQRRSHAAEQSGWDTYRMSQMNRLHFLEEWQHDAELKRYLKTLKHNYNKTITGAWCSTLQVVLTPLAVARVERMMIEACMTQRLTLQAKKWHIVVVERDVPCAAIAINVLKEKITHILALMGEKTPLPEIELCIVSSPEFQDSPLHLGQKVHDKVPITHFDLCIDIAMLLRDHIDSLPLSVHADTIYKVRSSHYKKRERTFYTTENIQYPPLVEKNNRGEYCNIKEREEILTYFLRDLFRKPSFRAGQLPIISRALSDKTTIGLLPTGGGKSLTYQLACMLQPGVAVVVDPLVSLMVDQERSLKTLRIDACACVHSRMSSLEKIR